MKAMKDSGGKEFLAVIVRGSAERPHFSGPSYIRDGMQSKPASEQQFARLIAERSSKVREILKWKDQQITLLHPSSAQTPLATIPHRAVSAHLLDCDQFFARLQIMQSGSNSKLASIPLSQVEVSFEPEGAGRLCLVIVDRNFYLERT